MASSWAACCKSQCYGIETSQVNPSFVEPNFSCLWKIFYASIEHAKEYPTTLHFFFHWNFQKYSVKIIYAIIDRVRLGIPK